MPISFTCPHCGRYTEVADEYAGQSGPCAGCGQTVNIPSAASETPLKSTSAPSRSSKNGFNTVVLVTVILGVMCVCGGGGLVALLLPAVQAAREAARRMQCSNNLKQIALAMHNYHDVHKCLPAGYVADEEGKAMHSWRVALLPYMEAQPLYDQYNFDEPWDSPNNLNVARQMPEMLRCPSAPESPPGAGMTNYVVVLSETPEEAVARNSLFGANSWTRFSDITDGTSNTLLVVEVKEPVPWTQPDVDLHFENMNFQVNGGANSIGSFHPSGANVAFADGSVQFVSDLLDTQTLRLMIQPADGTPVRFDAGF